MLVLALIASIWTSPEPTVLPILNSLDEKLAHFIGCSPRIAMFTLYNIIQLLLIPILHAIFLFLLDLILLVLLFIPRIGIQALLLCFPLHSQIVAEFAFAALVAVALLEELAEHCLGIDAEGNFLDLYGFEEFGDFFARFLCGLLFTLTR